MEVTTMKSARTIALGLSIILMMTAATPLVFAQAAHVRWDIVSINFATGTVSPGGTASAIAQDGSHIRLTGSGTFVAPGGGDGTSSATTGGGAWAVFAAGALTPSATGTYVVTGLVRWELAPGTFPANVDAIDDVTEAHGTTTAVLPVANGSVLLAPLSPANMYEIPTFSGGAKCFIMA
jgi:hypothetical protein